MDAGSFSLSLKRLENYQFNVEFDGTDLSPLLVDEPEPLGQGRGPNPTRMLAVAVGNCLSSSLLFCVNRAHIEVRDIETHVEGFLFRNEQKRIRVKELRVVITIEVVGTDFDRASRCLEIFEDFCTVTASVRKGIPVYVTVQSPKGYVFLESDGSRES